MSGGGPPHHPHNRHVPPTNSAWNHLPVPNYFPRQPQVAHMHAEPSLLHQASWHTPTPADAMKLMPHTQMLNEMFKNEALFPRDCVDLSLTRNGNQNGELPPTPAAISLSVRDTSKINSLPPSMLDIQAIELTKCISPNLKSAVSPGTMRTTSMSPGLKVASPGLLGSGPAMKSLSPGRKSLSPAPIASSPMLNLGSGLVFPPSVMATMSSSEQQQLVKSQKRSNIRVDSILERLNPTPDKTFPYQDIRPDPAPFTTTSLCEMKSQIEKPLPQSQSVIVQAASSYDENSNSSGTTNVPTPKEEDSASMNSNEDSLDSTKSRRKRKPSKTIRLNKEDEIKTERDQLFYPEANPSDHLLLLTNNHKKELAADLTPPHLASDPAAIATILEGTAVPKLPDRLESSTIDELDGMVPAKTRRKASSESETIDNIAAMVQEGLKEKGRRTTTAVVDGGGGEDEGKVEVAVFKNTQDDSEESKSEELMPMQFKSEDAVAEIESVPSTSEEVTSEEVTSEEVTSEATSSNLDAMSAHPEKQDEKSPELHITSAFTEDDTTASELPKDEDVLEPVPEDVVDGPSHKDYDLPEPVPSVPDLSISKPVTVSVIKTKEILEETLSMGHDVPFEPPRTIIESTPVSVLPPVALPLVTPAQKKASITHFVEVENKLEEMFAGIVEEDPVEATPANITLEPLKNDSTLGLIDDSFMKLDDSDASTKQEAATDDKEEAKTPEESPLSPKEEDVKKEEEEGIVEDKKPAAKKARRSRPPSKRESDHDGGEVPLKKKKLTKTKSITTPTKKPTPAIVATKSPKKILTPATSSRTPTKAASSDVAKEICFYDSGSNASSSKSRGPFVQIRGPRDSPLSVSVVNTPLAADEDGEKKSLKNKKFHDDSEYRHKVRSKGLHCSTLSRKYDAERKDASWICAFCKRGPHANELTGPSVISEVPAQGDLFGPYFITTQCPEFEKRLDDPFDRQFKSKKIGKVLDAQTGAAGPSAKNTKKTKRKPSESSTTATGNPTDLYLGITDTGSNNTYEVWMHEDCMVWSSGIYLVGPKIAGLEEAVWTCSNMPCAGCGLRGANIGCVKRGCLSASHLCCARKAHWRLDEDNFKAYCAEHSR